MYNHALGGYDCPFCRFARGEETAYNKRQDIVYTDDAAIAFISPKWWPNNAGHVLVIPKQHFENLYDMPDALLGHLSVVAKQIAITMKAKYRCDGTSTRQHNEPGGMQDVFHFHLHVFPRYERDNLYERSAEGRFVTQAEKNKFSQLFTS